MSINLLISRFFEILKHHNNNILATEILIFWKKGIIRSHQSKEKQNTGQTKKDQMRNRALKTVRWILNKGNNKITELRAILQRESQNS
jgi:hypothetical protein